MAVASACWSSESPHMDELTSLGVILLLALLAGHLVKIIRVPEVTGYLFAGVVLGPIGSGLAES